MLENLPEEDSSWRSVVSSFYTMRPDPDVITSFQASVAIRNHYNQLKAPPTSSHSAYVAPTFESVFAARHGRPTNSSGRPYCSGCKKLGHTVDNCYDLILAEVCKLNARLLRSLQLSLTSRSERANVVSEGTSGVGLGIVDDKDEPDGDDEDVALLTMALGNGEAFVSTSLRGRAKSAYRDHAYIDSGATRSISPIIEYFDPASLRHLKSPVVIHVRNNEMLLATAVGDILFLFNVGDDVKRGVVRDVLYNVLVVYLLNFNQLVAIFVAIFIVNSSIQNTTNSHHIYGKLESTKTNHIQSDEFYIENHHKTTVAKLTT